MLNFAKSVSQKAGHELMELQNQNLDIHYKQGRHIVTNADIQAEKLVITEIEKQYPKHSIYSEEAGYVDKKSDYLWIIDPLDGTNNYVRNIGPYSVSIALAHKKKIILGVVYNPQSKELFYAQKDQGAFLNGKKIMVNEQNENERSLIYISNLGKCYRFLPVLMETFGGGNIRTLTSTAYDLCGIAAGRIEGLIKQITPIKNGLYIGEDVLAAARIVEEAGGTVTDFIGSPWNVNTSGIVASNGLIHDKIVDSLK